MTIDEILEIHSFLPRICHGSNYREAGHLILVPAQSRDMVLSCHIFIATVWLVGGSMQCVLGGNNLPNVFIAYQRISGHGSTMTRA